jgi:hypothetical protein
LSLHPTPKAFFRSSLATFKRRAGELACRLATNHYVFYGLFILAASLIAGALTYANEALWRSTAALGTAIVIIGLLHLWVDARSARRSRHSHTKGRAKEW